MRQTIQLPDGQIDLAAREVQRTDTRAGLGDLEVRLLEFLAARDGLPAPPALLLQEVWGYHPDVETKAVPLLVRRLREKIERDPSAPEVLKSSRQAGYWLERREAPSLFARVAERSALDRALGAARLVTLHGPAGVGKSWLLQHALGGGRGRVIDLGGAATQDEVLERWAADLDLPSATPASVGLALRARKGLVVGLDGLERAQGVLAELLPRFLEEAPHLKVLVASRALLHVQGEHVVPVQPLDAEAGRALFLDAALRSGVDLGGANLSAVTARLDGLPLAIELAAARLRVLSLEELERHLAAPLPVLRGARSALEDTLALSWEGCSEVERQDLARLAALHGLLDVRAVEAVLGPGALDRLQGLVDKSLVLRGPPFGWLSTLRAFVESRTDDSARAEAVVAHARFLASFLPLADHARALLGGARPTEAARLLAGRADLVRGFRYAVAAGDRAAAVEIGMAHVQVERLLGSGAQVLLDELLALDELPPAARVVVLLSRSYSARRGGRDGDPDLEAAAVLAELTGDPVDRRNVLFARFAATEFVGRRTELAALSLEIEALADEMPDPAQGLFTLVTALSGRVDEGDPAAIERMRVKVEKHPEYLRQPRTRAIAQNYLTTAEADPEQKRRRAVAAAALFQEVGDRRAVCLAHFHEAAVLAPTAADASSEVLTRLAREADEIGLVTIALEARVCHAALRLIHDRPVQNLLDEAARLTRDPSSHFLVAATRMAAGEAPALERLSVEAPAQSYTDRLWFDWAEGELHWRAGDRTRAGIALARAAEAWDGLPRADRAWPHVFLASLARRLGAPHDFKV